MLQCTAVTTLPPGEALAVLLSMDDGPDDAGELLGGKPYVLCELGEHGELGEHAARLWTAETEPPVSLWFLWTDSTGGHRVHHRFTALPLCPVRIHHVKENYRQWCGLYDDHPGNHSFHVTDPLRDAHHAQIRSDAERAHESDTGDSEGS
ncbi:hypothetical protein ACF058_14670 [Streptomyces sp. NPDC015501]|uniref:hypothetical protein n=1 Tax=Streptomyces sp. NPDC015501 TaxID=3364959 RepID=UPI00119CB7E9|nr:hypothetical protein A3L22_17010 [Streptomyces griseus subsp. griseus]